MEKENIIKAVGAVAVAILVLNLILFSFLHYKPLAFWLIIALVAIIAFPLIKWLKSK
jgi:hypothetical protein